jgi:Zn-dependent M28 family amino/carboxypeptidase
MPSPLRQALACVAFVLAVVALADCTATPPSSRGAQARIAAAPMLHDVEALAADSMGGRGPGTEGDRMARAYLARRLEAIGFEPGGPDGSWEQPITLVGLTVKNFDEWLFKGPGGQAAFRWREDFIGGSGAQVPRVAVANAEVVFVGYGIQAPEFQWDDFKGADLEGKILLVLNSDPDWDPALFAGEKRLYYGRWDYKFESAARQGAAAAIILHTEESAGYGWNVVDRSWSGTQFEPPAAGEARLQLKSWLTEPAVRRLCALGGQDLDTLIAAARRREFEPVPLGVTTSLAFDVANDTIQTGNVVGVLPGSDPRLRDEVVVYSTHHDHLGIGEPDSAGDRIYNGAADNATGCAQVLAVAEAFAAMQSRPKRSVMALFVAGEEQGLVGSRYYVAHPTVPLARIAADINFDGGSTLGRASDVAVIGNGKSDLEDRLVTAARTQGRKVVAEPEPDKGYYYRSDQLSFARGGVPALYFKSGQAFIGRPAGWGKQKEAEFRRLHYHQPSDEIRPDWDLSGMAEDTRLAYLVGLDVADGSRRPAWYPGDEFEAARKQTLEQAAAGTR